MARIDVFPSTAHSWIAAELDNGKSGRQAINHFIMEIYAEPLRIYYKGGWRGRLGDADDIVQGFFADRLARDSFFESWLASGIRLRYWLMKAFSFYTKELVRAGRRHQRELPVEAVADLAEADEEAAETAMDRAFAQAVVQSAIERVTAYCEKRSLSSHLSLFLGHFRDGARYTDLCQDESVTPERAAVMARTVARRFRKEVREILQGDGATTESVDREIEKLLTIGE